MIVVPDFSEVSDAVAPGEYKARIVDGKLGAYPSGLKYINWRLETFDEADPKNNGRAVFTKTPITGKGAFRLADLYRAATRQNITGDLDTEQLYGKTVKIVVVDGTDKEGNPSGYVDVKAIKPL